MTTVTGVLPNEVIGDPASAGLIAFVQIDPNATSMQVQTFLRALTNVLRSLEEPDGGACDFTATVGFGPAFFWQAGNPRFGLSQDVIPLGLRTVPQLSNVQSQLAVPGDFVIYAMSRRDALFADLLQFLSTKKPPLMSVAIARGYQRKDKREQFGFLDGLRNISSSDRPTVITTSDDIEPDGPGWALGGTYMTYLKAQQNLPAATQVGTTAMEGAIGRRQVDGSRQDQPQHMNPRDEPDFDPAATQPALASHVRKAGPRGGEQSRATDVFLFRRGIPYTEIQPDLTLTAGLHFVAFAASLSYTDVVWNHWIMNPDFPTAGTGIDQLFQNNLVQVLEARFFFIPPDDSRFIGAAIFLGPEQQPTYRSKVVVRKSIVDQNGVRQLKRLSGFGFTVVDANNQPIGREFFTNSAGQAVSPQLPTGVALTLRETTNPPFQGQPLLPQGDIQIQPLTPGQPPPAISYTNRFPTPPPPGYR